MPDRIAKLEARLADVENRLRILEGESDAGTAARLAAEPTLGDGFASLASIHIGRVLLIFGGAYLLRAITDFQFVPTGFGIFLGASYALVWLFMAQRAGRQARQRAAAAFYGGTSVLLALPLLVEAHGHFELLTGWQAVLALGVFVALALLVAGIRQLRSLCWLATGGGIVAAFALLIASHAAAPVAAFLVLLGLGSLWTVYARDWLVPQWIGAFGANAGILSLVVFSNNDQWTIEPLLAAGFATGLVLAYLASFAIRSHWRGAQLGLFEIVQALVSIVIAFWAANAAAGNGQLELRNAGVLGFVLAAAAYAFALAPQTRAERGWNYHYYSTLGLLLVVGASLWLLSAAHAAVFWTLLAVLMAAVSGRSGRVSLSLQCTLLLVAGGIASGLLGTGWQALAGGGDWPAIGAWQPAVALGTVACLFIPVAQHSERWGTMAGLPQLLVLALSVWEVGGLFVALTAPWLAGGGAPDLAVLAALRSAVLSVAAVTLALSSRYRRWPEARWLVYPVLILVGIKLFVEDFPHGQPATLFVALAFIGSALLLVARLLARGAASTQGE